MRDEFVRLRAAIRTATSGVTYSDSDPAAAVSDPPHRRLITAIRSLEDAGHPGSADLVALAGHVLRREAVLAPGVTSALHVPTPGPGTENWPSAEHWRRAGISARVDGDALRLLPRPWTPDWLSAQDGDAFLRPLLQEEYRRTYEEVAGDPFLDLAGRSRYRCDAQREVVRAILSVMDGATLLANLPTGAGKSLCAHLPGLVLGSGGGVTVVIVPTVALAIDQAESVKNWVKFDTAYIGGSSVEETMRRRLIRERILAGEQSIVFAAPESVLGSMRPALYEAGRKGYLRLLVIDEAHIVEQWGDEFRSSFQEIAGLRKDLLRTVPAGVPTFKTLLLTATLTEPALDALEGLFGAPGPFTLLSAAQLRPEPSYWVTRAPSFERQRGYVLDALRHLPRPLILYCTRPAEAESWADMIRADGYRRFDVVTGKTPNAMRARAIDRWRAGSTDVVVATSAFGLGVDKADVRAVIHASVPENIDRYYQEVGRGGRDGNASVSLVIYTNEDEERARRLHRKTIIGIERGRQRWARMHAAATQLGEDRIRVPVDVPPGYGPADIEMENDLNESWNVRTLTLLSRAGLIELDAEPLARPEQQGTGSEQAGSAGHLMLTQQSPPTRVVRLLHHGTNIPEVWERQVEPMRRRIAEADERSHRLMLEMLRGVRCSSDVLCDAYDIPGRAASDQWAARPGVTVARACGGCAVCRRDNRQPFAAPLPALIPSWQASSKLGTVLGGLAQAQGHGRAKSRALAIFFDEIRPLQFRRLVRWFAAQGIRNVVMPREALVEFHDALADLTGSGHFVFTSPLDGFRFFRMPPVPTLVVAQRRHQLTGTLIARIDAETELMQLHVVVAPSDTPDPRAPHRLLRHTLRGRIYQFDEFSQVVGL